MDSTQLRSRQLRRFGLAMAGLCSALPALSLPALAQTAPQGPASDTLEEIVVTAERRESSIQNVPISVSALSGDTLVKSGIQNTQELVDAIPGLIVQRSVVGKISIRGIGNENYTISGDPGVALHTDGVYVARPAAGLFDLFDVGRVEVLRGPQGTLYGRNATGGVINVIPVLPGSELSGYGSLEVGDYNHVRVEAAAGGPITDVLEGRVAVLGAWRDGYTKNLFPGAEARGYGDLDNQDLKAVRAQLAFNGSDVVKARLAVEYIDDGSNPSPYKYLNQPSALPNQNYYLGQLRTVSQGYETAIPGSTRNVGSDDDIFATTQLGVSLHLDFDLGDLTLKSITGFRETTFHYLDDGDGAAVFYVNYIQQDHNYQVSQEFQLANETGGEFEWIAGAFFFHENGTSFIALPFASGANLPFYIRIDGGARTRAAAGFGEFSWNATDQLKLTVGGRYSLEGRGAAYRYEVNFGGPSVVNPNLERAFASFTPRFVADYRVLDNLNTYISITKGFKSGGFNLLAIQPGFAPEKVWNYEAGVKSTFLDGKVRVNADFFYMDYTDQQVGQIVNLSSVLTNAASSRIYGVEAELQARPIPPLELDATLAYLNARYENFCTGDPTKPTAPVSPGCTAANPIQLAGNTLPRSPDWTATAAATYTFDLAELGSLAIRGDMRYQSNTFFTQFNRPLISQPAYVVANARVTWTSADTSWSIAGWVKNLTGENYFTEVLESGAFNPQLVGQAYVAPPRTFGFTGTYRF